MSSPVRKDGKAAFERSVEILGVPALLVLASQTRRELARVNQYGCKASNNAGEEVSEHYGAPSVLKLLAVSQSSYVIVKPEIRARLSTVTKHCTSVCDGGHRCRFKRESFSAEKY